MRFPKIALTSVLASAALTGTAFAETFDGPFVGVQSGWNSYEVRNVETPLGVAAINDDQQSFTAGVYAGFDHRLTDRVVLGVEGSLDTTNDDRLHGSTISGSWTPNIRSISRPARASWLHRLLWSMPAPATPTPELKPWWRMTPEPRPRPATRTAGCWGAAWSAN